MYASIKSPLAIPVGLFMEYEDELEVDFHELAAATNEMAAGRLGGTMLAIDAPPVTSSTVANADRRQAFGSVLLIVAEVGLSVPLVLPDTLLTRN
jgi:hypothetical protein